MAVDISTDNTVDISIIVPMFDSEKTIKQCITSLLDSKFDGNREIIVVDDGSTDRSEDLIRNFPIRIIFQENKGAATAKNLGAKHAKGIYLVFVDSDVVFFQDTLKKIFSIIQQEKYHYVGTRYSEYPANNAFIHKYKALHDYYFSYHMFYNKTDKITLDDDPIPTNGGVEAFKKKTFLELGGYDESIQGAGVEREELFTRLKQKYRYVLNSGVVTQHYFPDFRQLTRNFFQRTQGTLQLINEQDYFSRTYKKLRNIVIFTPITSLSFFFSTIFTILFYSFVSLYLFIVPAIFCACYVTINRGFFVMAYQKQGFIFMIYTIIIHFFFSNIIALSGFIIAIKRKKTGKT